MSRNMRQHRKRNLTCRVDFQLTENQRRKLEDVALKQGITMTQWFRRQINEDYERIFGREKRCV